MSFHRSDHPSALRLLPNAPHDEASVRSLLDRLEVFQQGMCVVHHMFGDSVVDDLETYYPDALLTAHLEVGTVPTLFVVHVIATSFES